MDKTIEVEKALNQSKCPYKEWCWRLVYTAVCKDQPYTMGEAPERFDVLCAGGLNGFANIFPFGGVYCKKLPHSENGKLINECPSVAGRPFKDCTEYRYEEKRKKQKNNTSRPRNLSHNVRRIRKKIDPKVIKAVYQRFRYNCAYCGINQNQKTPDGRRVVMTVDHRVPLNMGGTDEYCNLALACRTCNSMKKDQLWELGCRK